MQLDFSLVSIISLTMREENKPVLFVITREFITAELDGDRLQHVRDLPHG
jgi:hypothetical protein